MTGYFLILGILSLIFSTFLGYQSDHVFLGFISGIFSGSVFMGIAILMEGHKRTQELIGNSVEVMRRYHNREITCKKCGKIYEGDRKSCPFCGYKGDLL